MPGAARRGRRRSRAAQLSEPRSTELAAALGEAVASVARGAGGSINEAWRVELANGRSVFVKSRAGATPRVRRRSGRARVARRGRQRCGSRRCSASATTRPGSRSNGSTPGSSSSSGRGKLGRGLAEIHRAGAPALRSAAAGAAERGRARLADRAARAAGVETELARALRRAPPAPAARDGARVAGAIDERDGAAVELVCERIEELGGPPEPPARIHGDLWSGNVIADRDGLAWLIDPARMRRPPRDRPGDVAPVRAARHRLFDEYDEVHSRAEGHEERVELWQLLPLLVHAVLFGGGYGAQAGDAARRYA